MINCFTGRTGDWMVDSKGDREGEFQFTFYMKKESCNYLIERIFISFGLAVCEE